MPTKPTAGYKETTLQQLRSFHETARLGSLAAAAESLGLAHPTVWQQVHALERDIGEKLVETSGRGCKLTDAGRVLAEIAAPVVLGANGLKARFREAWAGHRPKVVVCATPRAIVEDAPPCAAAFTKRHPGADLVLREGTEAEALAQVVAGAADLAILSGPAPAGGSVECEPAYELDLVLVVPKNHPLAKKPRFRPQDLRGYPLVSGPRGFGDSPVWAELVRLTGAVEVPCRAETQFTATAREFVRLGYGVAVVGKSPLGRTPPGLFERDVSKHFGRVAVNFARRRGLPAAQAVRDFMAVVRETLGRPRG